MKRVYLTAFAIAATLMIASSSQSQLQDSQGIPDEDRSNFQAMTSTPSSGAMRKIEITLEALAESGDDDSDDQAKERKKDRGPLIRAFVETYEAVLGEDDLAKTVVERESDERWQHIWLRMQTLLLLHVEKQSDIHRAWLSEFSSQAEVAYESALRDNELSALLNVARRFPLSPVAYKATLRAGRLAFSRGKYGDVAVAYRLAIGLSEFGTAEASELAAAVAEGLIASRALGWADYLHFFEVEAVARSEEMIQIGEDEITLGEWFSEFDESETPTDSLSRPLPEELAHPLATYSGQPSTQEPKHLDELAWDRVAIPARQISTAHHGSLQYIPAEVPPAIATVDEGAIIVNSGERLLAYDFFSGDRIWGDGYSLPTAKHAFRFRQSDPNLLLTSLKYKNLAIAALENPLVHPAQSPATKPAFGYDVYSAFTLVKRALVAVDASNGNKLWQLGGKYQPDKSGSALDIRVSQMSFSTTTIVDDTLYALGSIRGNESRLYLVAIDPHKGEALWSLLIGAGQGESNMFGNPMRAALPGIPVYSQGTLYIQTNIGGVVAVDLSAAAVRWVSRYPALPRPYTRNRQPVYRKRTFANGAPVVCRNQSGEEIVVVGATDSRYLCAFRASDGKRIWTTPVENAQRYPNGARDRNNDHSPTIFVGVHNGLAVIGQESALFRLSLEDGTVHDNCNVSRTYKQISYPNSLAARPAIGGNTLYWPGEDGVSVIDLSKATLPNKPQKLITSALSGNLQVAHGALVNLYSRSIQSSRRDGGLLEVRFDPSVMLEQAQQASAADPNNPKLLLRLALLAKKTSGPMALQDDEIIKVLESAIRLSAKRPEYAEVLSIASREYFERLIRAARKASLARDAAKFNELIERARPFALNESHQLALYSMDEEFAVDFGDAKDLIAFYRKWSESDKSFEVSLWGVRHPVALAAKWHLARGLELSGQKLDAVDYYDRVIAASLKREDGSRLLKEARARIAAIVAADPNAYTDLEIAALEAENKAKALTTPAAQADALLLVFERYSHAKYRARLLRETLGVLKDEQEFSTYSARILAGIQQLEVSEESATMLVSMLARHVEANNIFSAWELSIVLNGYSKEINVRYKGETVSISEVLKSLDVDSLLANNDLSSTQMLLPLSKSVKWKSDLSTEVEGEIVDAAQAILISEVQGEDDVSFAAVTYLNEYGRGIAGVLAFETKTGKELWIAPNVTAARGVVKVDSHYIFVEGSSLVAINPQTGKSKWTLQLRSSISSVEVVAGIALCVVHSRRERATEFKAMAIDCVVGEIKWERELGDFGSTSFALNGRWLYALDNGENSNAELTKIDFVSGKVEKVGEIPGAIANRRPLHFGPRGEIIFSVSSRKTRQSQIVIVDALNLSILSHQDVDRRIYPWLAVEGETCVLIDNSGYIEARDIRTWALKWSDTSVPGRTRIGSRVVQDGKLLIAWQPDSKTQVAWSTVYDIERGKRVFHQAIWEPKEGESAASTSYQLVPVKNGAIALLNHDIKVEVKQPGRRISLIRSIPAAPKVIEINLNTLTTKRVSQIEDIKVKAAAYYRTRLFVPTKHGLLISDGDSKIAFLPTSD